MADLLSQIESDLVSGAPIADTLRKCVLLGGRAGSAGLREWATRELRGYPAGEDVPDYRIRGATLQVDAMVGPNQITGQRIDPAALPKEAREHITEELPFRQGVAELAALVPAGEDSVKLTFPRAAYITQLMDQRADEPFQHITALYWRVSRASVEGILDEVRTSLAELVAEMRAATPHEGDEPTATTADRALDVVLGDGARLVTINAAAGSVVSGVTTGDAAAIKQRTHVTLRERVSAWSVGRKIATGVVGAVSLVAGVVALYQFLSGL